MTAPANARAKEFDSPFGASAVIDTQGIVTVRDASGMVRATYQGAASKYPDPGLPHLGSHIVVLPEGEVELFNGSKGAFRRREHNGHVELHGRRYEFLHTRRWNTEVRCDGVRIALLRRRSSNSFKVRVNEVRDETDLFATILCWFAVRPGRGGAILELLGGF